MELPNEILEIIAQHIVRDWKRQLQQKQQYVETLKQEISMQKHVMALQDTAINSLKSLPPNYNNNNSNSVVSSGESGPEPFDSQQTSYHYLSDGGNDDFA
jgi:hypothetical protein